MADRIGCLDRGVLVERSDDGSLIHPQDIDGSGRVIFGAYALTYKDDPVCNRRIRKGVRRLKVGGLKLAKLAVPSFIVGLLGFSAAHAENLPCTLMVLDSTDRTYLNKVLAFTNTKSAADFFGSQVEANIAKRFFNFPPGGSCTNQTIKFLRFPITSARAHLYGGNLESSVSGLSGSGIVQVTSDGSVWQSGSIVLSTDLSVDKNRLMTAINGLNNSNLPIITTFYGSLAPASCSFLGYLSYITLNATNNGSCVNGPPLGSQICDATFTGNDNGSSCSGGQVTSNQQNMVNSLSYRNNKTSRNSASLPNVETYSLFLKQGEPKTTNNTNLTAYYEVLTISQMSSGTISVGQQIQDGNAVSKNTCVIWSNISGSGNGSTWLVSCENPTEVQENEKMSTSPCSLEVISSDVKGVNPHLEVSSNNYCPFSTTSIDYLTDIAPGTVATQLLLTSTSNGSYASSPGGIITNIASGMNAVVALDSSFDAYITNYDVLETSPTNYAGGPSMPYGALPDFLAWTKSQPNHLPAYNYGWK
jgi:hypothetical protein